MYRAFFVVRQSGEHGVFTTIVLADTPHMALGRVANAAWAFDKADLAKVLADLTRAEMTGRDDLTQVERGA